MSEFIAIGVKRSLIVLADELDYRRAAKALGLTSAELRKQIAGLEAQLYFHIFKPRRKQVELTEEGQFLIRAFRQSAVLHNRNASKIKDESR